MATGVSDFPELRTRANQDETSPFLLELMVASPLGRQRGSGGVAASQDETSPFLLEFQVVARQQRQTQGETAPLPKKFLVLPSDGAAVLEHAASVHASPADALPRLKWRGIDASAELREYAARVAAGEDLPPYRGPILASGDFPDFGPDSSRSAYAEPSRAVSSPAVSSPTLSSRPGTPAGRTSEATAFLKLALALILLSAALVASAVLGDDTQLRAAGQSISSWLGGASGSLETFPLSEPTRPSANVPCETSVSSPAP